ncbi:pseudaminic acid cytidylyltransferase [Polynucleobacter paneuropaeus]|jgi:N-acylneuraminate cytidylyltransferase|nr:pseudaminic acid cytidylyltransferase [Polynucleobacter paneuropaeus]MBT8576709.1 pseudaminic acid cytidylyltransferase [Polynucleobacter paneuropaeus]MBT8615102.1 pseudaminic acid cytidylyltransferase [Polynucleobacter paneuropaeus]MBT8616583.1 pseudaminic acid cytidylyltransferase [Polynucleobacter paneuropaeus]MBT8618464.1 pseudaminic acid cytidylyltransferase [Polynucleobacter paneuropaeus]
MNIAIIPARGGSKRIPKKNIKQFCGKPMIAYAIDAARSSGLFEHVVVSTDDKEIARVAKDLGAEIPFIRPGSLSTDYIETVPVISHATKLCIELGWSFKQVCCIYPAVPFIQAEDLKGALTSLINEGADYCFPVSEYPSAPQRALKFLEKGRMAPFYPEYELVRTQDLEPTYFDVGQFYWGVNDAWLNNSKIHSSGLGYVIPSWRVVDIDTDADWKRAELLYKSLNG